MDKTMRPPSTPNTIVPQKRYETLKERAFRKDRQRPPQPERSPEVWFTSWDAAQRRGYVWERSNGTYECPRCPLPLTKSPSGWVCHLLHVRIETEAPMPGLESALRRTGRVV